MRYSMSNIPQCSYFGKVGFLCLYVIPVLTRYLKNNTKIAIQTYPHYAEVLSFMFGPRVICYPTDVNPSHRHGFHGGIRHKDNLISVCGSTLSESGIDTKYNQIHRLPNAVNGKYISIIPKSGKNSHNNLSITQWHDLLPAIRKRGYKVVCHGLDSEIHEVAHDIRAKTLLDSMRYFRSSELAVSSINGLSLLSAMCGCRTVSAVDTKDRWLKSIGTQISGYKYGSNIELIYTELPDAVAALRSAI